MMNTVPPMTPAKTSFLFWLKRSPSQNRLSKRGVSRSRGSLISASSLIDELLARETVEIERTPIGQHVDAMPAVREEDDTIVVPIVEEVLVVERRLFLKEEVRIRRVRSTERHQETVTLRHQEAVVTRLPVEAPATRESPVSGEKVDQSNQE